MVLVNGPDNNNSSVHRSQVEDFLFMEARLLDDKKYDEWLELFTSDAIYWVPSNGKHTDPARQVSIIYDDRKRMSDRIWRLQSGQAYAQSPPSNTSRLISNVQLEQATGIGLVAASNFIVAEVRRHMQTIYAGRYEHHLVLNDGKFSIAMKKVVLVNNAVPLGNLSFLL